MICWWSSLCHAGQNTRRRPYMKRCLKGLETGFSNPMITDSLYNQGLPFTMRNLKP